CPPTHRGVPWETAGRPDRPIGSLAGGGGAGPRLAYGAGAIPRSGSRGQRQRQFAERVDVHHLGLADASDSRCPAVVQVDMTVEVVAWPEGADEPAEGFEAVVASIGLIVDAFGRRVRDQHIQKAPILDAIHQQAGNNTPYRGFHL